MPSYKRAVPVLILILVAVFLQTGRLVSAHCPHRQYKPDLSEAVLLASPMENDQNYRLIISDLHSVQLRYIYV